MWVCVGNARSYACITHVTHPLIGHVASLTRSVARVAKGAKGLIEMTGESQYDMWHVAPNLPLACLNNCLNMCRQPSADRF